MRLSLFYHFYTRQNFSSEDYFSDILKDIEDEYPHKVESRSVIYLPINADSLEEATKKKLQILDKEVNGKMLPHYVIAEMVVTFYDINEDYRQDRDHIIEKFGSKAIKYQLIEEGMIL
jgi:hypothetical protein